MQPQLGIWKRFIRSLLGVDRCSLSWGSGRGLLEVYQGWTDAASAGDQEDHYCALEFNHYITKQTPKSTHMG